MKALSLKDKALLFAELSRLEQSGIARLKSLSLLEDGSTEVSKRVTETLRLCHLKLSFSAAAFKSGLIDQREQVLFELANESAQYEQVFNNLASFYQRRYLQQKKMLSRLLLPALIFLLALFISPLPALVNNDISFAEYLYGIVGTVLKFLLIVLIFLTLPQWLQQGKLGEALKAQYDRILLKIPFFSRLYMQHVLLDYFRLLALCLKSGLPVIKALKLSEKNIINTAIQKKLAVVPRLIEQGMTFSGALRESLESFGGFEFPEIQQTIYAGEFSGTLEDSIEKMVLFLDEFQQQNMNLVFEWVPRIIYLLVLLMLAYALI